MYKIIQVLVLFTVILVTSGQYGYPGQQFQPYPYPQQYPGYGGDVSHFGQGYPQGYGQGYPQMYPHFYPYPYQPMYPNYAPQYPSYYPTYPSYPSNYPEQSISGGLPSQYPPGTNVYPTNYPVPTPPSVETPYGNIPVEVIDVDGTNERTIQNGTVGEIQLVPVGSESQSFNNVVTNPVKSTKYDKIEPSQTKIVRTFDPKNGKFNVEVQTDRPPAKSDKNNDNRIDSDEEDNDTTTKWSLFG